MADPDYWKVRYADLWSTAASREEWVATLLEQRIGRCVFPVGLGAGSDTYLPGYASEHGKDKGGPDLWIEDSDVYIEVTGPLRPGSRQDPLWIRPDKVQHAREHPTSMMWVVHVLPNQDGSSLIRCLRMDQTFYQAVDDGEIETVRPTIRGTEERYLAVSPSSPLVDSFPSFVRQLLQELE